MPQKHGWLQPLKFDSWPRNGFNKQLKLLPVKCAEYGRLAQLVMGGEKDVTKRSALTPGQGRRKL